MLLLPYNDNKPVSIFLVDNIIKHGKRAGAKHKNENSSVKRKYVTNLYTGYEDVNHVVTERSAIQVRK